MLRSDFTNRFKKDYKRAGKRGWDLSLLDEAIRLIVHEQPLPATSLDHSLVGDFAGCRECHLRPDWLLVYQVGNGAVVFERTGSHSDLF
ncbi:MAG: type II toxin-antitoxin system YafQ family toxin [Bifidobacteriaceae bacterium]|jgi:mRNA interferase YafQ|nr:type II toxin-antitoxin system YafQ family toxin [Bifidobacteriaceae bacterium]